MSQSLTLEPKPKESSLDDLAWMFKALGDPARLKIVQHLANQSSTHCCGTGSGICACDFEQLTGLKQPTVSHHMKCLISANLVTAEKRGRWMYYQINSEGFKALTGILNKLT